MKLGTPRTPVEPAASSAIRRLRGFDALVLAGGLVNLIVIALLVGYWLLH